jgi:hypothetical protein
MITDSELAGLEDTVQEALRRGDPRGLPLLGEGEISLVLRAGGAPGWACKLLPPFATGSAAERYASTIDRYVDTLTDRGVRVLDTTVRRVAGPDGSVVLYCIQPVLPTDTLAAGIAGQDPTAGSVMVAAIVDVVLGVVDGGVGLDAQLSNWAIVDGELVYLDITTPLLRRPDGTSELDTDVFVASLPWALRGAVQHWFVPSILARYHDPRTVVVDVAANLLKEGLDELVPGLIAATDGRIEPALSEDEVRRDRRSDAVTWTGLQMARRLDRVWQRRIRRRPYPFLLPTHRRS